jgi:cold shock protein
MATGKVKTVTGKGFGFIATPDAEKDVFYHENNLEGELATRKLQVGDDVTFDIETTEKGLNATNIKLAVAE